MDPSDYYSNSYLGARDKFLKIVAKTGGKHHGIRLDGIYGAEKEELFIDIAHFGSINPDNLVMHFSGIHGVEGFVGSAIQCHLIENLDPNQIKDGQAITFVHCVNPYGMSHFRKYNENNVDLNKNFRRIYKQNYSETDYDQVSTILNPTAEVTCWSISYFVGMLKTLFTGTNFVSGQNRYPAGLFNFGTKLEPALEKLMLNLRLRYSDAKQITVVDVHGCNDICGSHDDDLLCDDGLMRLLKDELANNGLLTGIIDNFPRANCRGVVQRFPISSIYKEVYALRMENYYHNYECEIDNRHRSKQLLFNTYVPNDRGKKIRILEEGKTVFDNILSYFFSVFKI